MKNIIEYEKSEFLNLLLEHEHLIDNLFIFENNDSDVFYKGECQLTDDNIAYKFYFPSVNWKLTPNVDILSVIDTIKANNLTMFIKDYNLSGELLEDVFNTFLSNSIQTKYWIAKNDESLYSKLWQTLNHGQYFTIIL